MFLFLLLLFLFILRLAYSIWREVRFEWSESPYAANESDEWRTLIETLNFSTSSSSFLRWTLWAVFLSLDLLHLVENRLVHVLCKVENVIQIHKFGNGMRVLHLIAFAYQKKTTKSFRSNDNTPAWDRMNVLWCYRCVRVFSDLIEKLAAHFRLIATNSLWLPTEMLNLSCECRSFPNNKKHNWCLRGSKEYRYHFRITQYHRGNTPKDGILPFYVPKPFLLLSSNPNWAFWEA